MLPLIAYIPAGLVLVLCASYFGRSKEPNLSHIPSVGSSGWLSWVDALQYLRYSWKVTKAGYLRASRNGLFKVPLKEGWMVYCCGPQYADEIRRAREDELSLYEALDEVAHMKLSMGEEIFRDPYHIEVIRSTLTRNITARFDDMREEIVHSFEHVLSLRDNEWKSFTTMDMVLECVSRISNRVFVGLPLCRNPDYLYLSIQYTVDVIKTAFVIDILPKFLRKPVGKHLTKLPYYVDKMAEHLMPIFEERQRLKTEFNLDWSDQPNDYITWLLAALNGEKRSVRDMMVRMLAINFGGIHTSSAAFSHVLYDLAANPEYVRPLRKEVESIVGQHGWSRASIDQMDKLDSFIRESQRMHCIGSMAMTRVAVKDFTFSDGTVLPAGTVLALPLYATHRDEEIYGNPDVFDPERFSKLREEVAGQRGGKYQMAASNSENLTWGLGKHVCPGRYFATIELKTMLAHVVLTYDVKMEKGVRPADTWIASICMPSRSAKILFRKRAD